MPAKQNIANSVANVLKSKNVSDPIKKTVINSLTVLGVTGLALLTLYRLNCQPTQ